MSDVTPSTCPWHPKTPPTWQLQISPMTITNFNYEGSYLPGVICNNVIKSDFGRSITQMHHGIYIMGCVWQTFWILQEKLGISFYFCIMRLVNIQLALYSHVRCNHPWHPLEIPLTPLHRMTPHSWQLQISIMRAHMRWQFSSISEKLG